MISQADSPIKIPLEKAWAFEAEGDIITATGAYGMVFFMSKNTGIHALDATSGKQRWNFKTTNTVLRPLLVADGTLYVFGTSKGRYEGSNERILHAIDAQTGEKRWQFSTSNVKGLPLGFNYYEHVWFPFVKNGVVYIVGDDKTLYALNAQNGTERWRFSSNKEIGHPAFGYGMVFFGSKDKRVYALDSSSGEKRWEFESGHKAHCCPIVTDNKILIGGNDDLYCLDSANGTLLWKIKKILHFGAKYGYGNPPVVVGNRIISPKELTVIDLATGEIVSKLLPERGFIKGKFSNHSYEKNDVPYMVKNVSVDNGILYLIHEGVISAIDLMTLETKWLTFVEEELGRFWSGELAGWTISGDYLFATAVHSMTTHCINLARPKVHWDFGPYSVPIIMDQMVLVYEKKEMCGYMSSKDSQRVAECDVEYDWAPVFFSELIHHGHGLSGQVVWPNCCCTCCGPAEVLINLEREYAKNRFVLPNVPFCRKCVDEGKVKDKHNLTYMPGKPNRIWFRNSKYATMYWIANHLR